MHFGCRPSNRVNPMKNESGLGKSQKKVLEWLKKNGPATTKEIGAALYDLTSSCASRGYHWWPKEKVQTHWAGGLLTSLKKKGLVKKTGKKWAATVTGGPS